MNQQELKTVLDLHRKWVLAESDGKRADLQGADLQRADLQRADLQRADLQGADLQRADLRGADLRGAYLQGADLRGADLRGADLREAKLDPIRDDFYAVLEKAPTEALGLLDALERGRVNGSAYQGECACLVGTIANLRHESHVALTIDLKPDANRPAEKWFLAIDEGDVPSSNPISAITVEWMRSWLTARGVKYPRYEMRAVWDETTAQVEAK